MKRFLFALAGSLVLLAAPSAGRAARVEADPNKEYPISSEAGPYIICVRAYNGPNSRSMANQLTLYLRKNGWPAYVFDYSAEEKRKAQELLDERYRNLPPDVPRRKTIRVEDQWAVFIGGYKDFDSASDDLPKLKKTPWDVPELKPLCDHTTGQTSGGARVYQISPFAYAIAARNPTVQVPKPDPNAPDPAWKDLNDGRPYNLLGCPKPWTLAVKQFQAPAMIQARSASSKFLDMLSFGKNSEDLLVVTAKQAEEVARVLREMKFQAYVLHTRGGSVVTVGGFDGPDDPALRQTAEAIKGRIFKGTNIAVDPMFKFFDQPLPMKVPKL
jgi:hypothetical protein